MLSTCKVGDIIMNSTGNRSKVMSRSHDLIARSCFYAYDTFSAWISIKDLEHEGWKVLVDGKEVLTKKEAEEILNVTIS